MKQEKSFVSVYRHTRQKIYSKLNAKIPSVMLGLAGPGGIEPPPEVLETPVLPLYDGPIFGLAKQSLGIVSKGDYFCKEPLIRP